MVAFYNAADQELYKKYKFLPQEKYRLGLTLPTDSVAPVPGGITNTNAFTGSGGDNFSVYNPDPNSISNRDYNPRPYYDATYEDTFGTNLGDPEALTATGARFAEPNTKMSGILNMIPGAGIARFLGNQIGPYIPPNRRAIMENQLSGQGIMVNDIGQIVQGDGAYDDISGRNVMAGYNANKMTAKTFDDRIEMAKNKMSDENKGARIAALEAAKADFLAAQGKTKTIYDFEEEEKKKNKKNTVINRFITKKKETKAAADAQAAATTTAVGGTTTSSGLSSQEQQTLNNAYNAQSQASRNRQDQAGGSGGGQFDGASSKSSYDSDPTSYSGSFAKGGRAGYFFGGRVNYKKGGRTDAESQYGEDSAGSYDSSQNKSGRQQSYGGDNNPSFYEPKTSVFNNPEILSKETIIGDVPMGIGFDNSYGRYKATMDLEESLKEKGLEGGIEYNNNIGNFDLAAKYNTQDGPSYGAGYTGNNFDVRVNNKTGASANYSKDIFDGRGKITAGGTYNPDGTYNAEGKISFNYANGGLAGLL